MKALCALSLLLCSPLALGQGAPPPLDIDNPASFGTKRACLVECERVFSDCQLQCRNTSARADERHFETPDLPVPQCIAGCQLNLGLCKKDC